MRFASRAWLRLLLLALLAGVVLGCGRKRDDKESPSLAAAAEREQEQTLAGQPPVDDALAPDAPRAGSPSAKAAGSTPDAAVAAGLRMYREGIRPSGQPLTATVTGDVPFLGTQFSCQSCHGRSGMGAAEGAYIVPAIAGRLLYAPAVAPARPAYDQSSLARALREGVDPAGRPLKPLMPRYALSDDEVASLGAYLAGLSVGQSPGIDDKAIRLATVVTDDVSPGAREALLSVLRAYVDGKNRQTRLESERPDRGTTPESQLPPLFREWQLDVWTLTGPSEGWREQLEKRYQSAPVFAVLSGATAGSWGPIGRFCEAHEIPCLFPTVDFTNAEEGDFYTFHFSRGLELEADLIASHLGADSIVRVVQVFCGSKPARAATALRSRLTEQGLAVEDIEFACEQPLPLADIASRMGKAPGSAAVVWVPRDRISGLEQALPPGRMYFSSTLLDREIDGPLLSAPGPIFLAHPYRLPGKPDPGFLRFKAWARAREIELNEPRLQSGAFFACLALNDGISHMERYRVRDYVLDMLDHAQDLASYLPIYPRATLGPGQRFLTKGGYVLPIVGGRPNANDAVWIAP